MPRHLTNLFDHWSWKLRPERMTRRTWFGGDSPSITDHAKAVIRATSISHPIQTGHRSINYVSDELITLTSRSPDSGIPLRQFWTHLNQSPINIQLDPKDRPKSKYRFIIFKGGRTRHFAFFPYYRSADSVRMTESDTALSVQCT